ncbi:MAG: HAD family phosphatase [Pseudomonadales bacterium]|nr:HAD family phosphatase [Pseudomonadales bacterium]
MSDIEAVLFDFGGVFTASPFRAVEKMAQDLEVDVAVFCDVMFGPYHEDTDHPWHALERGELSLEQAREAILELGKRKTMDVDLYQLLMKMAGANLVHESVVGLLREVKKAGYKTAIVTNNVREFSDGWRALMPVDDYVDKVIDSSFHGVRKPDARIFSIALDELGGIAADKAVFLDDVPANVASARTLGIHGIDVTDSPSETVKNLRDFLCLSF